MSKHVILSAPEAQPSLTCLKVRNASIDLVTGEVHLTFDKCDAADNAVLTVGVTWPLSAGNLSSVATTLLASAQAAGKIPAGAVEEVAAPAPTTISSTPS